VAEANPEGCQICTWAHSASSEAGLALLAGVQDFSRTVTRRSPPPFPSATSGYPNGA
jgi:hypothetical protein